MRKTLKIILFACAFLILPLQTLADPHAEVKVLNGQPTLFIKNMLYPPFAYMSYLGEPRYYREAAESGIHLFCFPVYLGDRGINSTSGIGPFSPPVWLGENIYDYSPIENEFRKIVSADPQAEVIIRIHLDVPGWWDARYPAECTLLGDGTPWRQNFSSELWRKQAGEALGALVTWLLDSPYAAHLAGIHVAAGFTEEWFYHFTGDFTDENPLRTRAFREWLRVKYRNNPEALKAAWNNKEVTFADATLSDISGKNKEGVWRDPEKNQALGDTFRFHAETMADNIAYFCGIVKKASHRALLTGAFYGYHFYVTDPRRGHGALGRLLECPDLDYLSSPNVYNRVMGEDWPPMAAVQSVRLHGKLWMAENDTRTSLTTLLKDRAPSICPPGEYEGGVWLGPPDIESSTALLLKNAARMLCYGYGGWWFDMWGGWFSDPKLMKVLKITGELYNKYPAQTDGLLGSQVCVLADEELQYLDASFGTLTETILSNRYALGRSGAPYDLYLRSDIERLPAVSYRVIWLLGIPALTEEESRKIRDWKAAGITVLWTGPEGTIIHESLGNTKFFKSRYAWSSLELRRMWRDSGVHLYIETDDVLYAGNGWLSIHTIAGGERLVRMPFSARIVDALTGTLVADSARSFMVDLASGSTSLFRVEPAVEKQ